jgi:hypothetical protein
MSHENQQTITNQIQLSSFSPSRKNKAMTITCWYPHTAVLAAGSQGALQLRIGVLLGIIDGWSGVDGDVGGNGEEKEESILAAKWGRVSVD